MIDFRRDLYKTVTHFEQWLKLQRLMLNNMNVAINSSVICTKRHLSIKSMFSKCLLRHDVVTVLCRPLC